MKNLFFKTNRLDSAYAYLKSHRDLETADALAEAMLQAKEKEWSRFNCWVRTLLGKSVLSAANVVVEALNSQTEANKKLIATLEKNYKLEKLETHQATKNLSRYRQVLNRRFSLKQKYPICQKMGTEGLQDPFIEKLFELAIRFLKTKLPKGTNQWEMRAATFLDSNWGVIKKQLNIFSQIFGPWDAPETARKVNKILEFIQNPKKFSSEEQRQIRQEIKQLLSNLRTGKDLLSPNFQQEFYYEILPLPLRILFQTFPEYPRQRFLELVKDPGPISEQTQLSAAKRLHESQQNIVELDGRPRSASFHGNDLRMSPVTIRSPARVQSFKSEDYPPGPDRAAQVRKAVAQSLVSLTEDKDPDYLVMAENLIMPLHECDAEAVLNDPWFEEFDPNDVRIQADLLSKTIEKRENGFHVRFDFDFRLLEPTDPIPLEKHRVSIDCQFEKSDQKWHRSALKWNHEGPQEILDQDKIWNRDLHPNNNPLEHFDDEGVAARPE